jgi:hypothetical protein
MRHFWALRDEDENWGFAPRLPVSLNGAVEQLCVRDGYSMNRFVVAAVAETFSVMQG